MTERDAKGRYRPPDPPDPAPDENLIGHMEGRSGWHLAPVERVPAWAWLALGAVTGWALTAIAFVAAGR